MTDEAQIVLYEFPLRPKMYKKLYDIRYITHLGLQLLFETFVIW